MHTVEVYSTPLLLPQNIKINQGENPGVKAMALHKTANLIHGITPAPEHVQDWSLSSELGGSAEHQSVNPKPKTQNQNKHTL